MTPPTQNTKHDGPRGRWHLKLNYLVREQVFLHN